MNTRVEFAGIAAVSRSPYAASGGITSWRTPPARIPKTPTAPLGAMRVGAPWVGATWVGGTFDRPPVPLDAAIVLAPAGEIVPPALGALDRGGVLVLGGIHMSDLPSFPYSAIYGERAIVSVTNNTRADARDFLAEAPGVVTTHVRTFPFEHANEALLALEDDAIRGAAVLLAPA